MLKEQIIADFCAELAIAAHCFRPTAGQLRIWGSTLDAQGQ